MYDTNNAPRRRMYINGYYSDEFQIKSGVAQGCPLSPLLFLIVAEALRVSIDMETGFKGIKVGSSYYKLSQFADDTTVLIGNKREVKLVNRAPGTLVQSHRDEGKHAQARGPRNGKVSK